jgi:small GTP-binding protein
MNKNKMPIVALIGLPNAGKSTLMNRLCGKKSIVAREEHTSRDLVWGQVEWGGYTFQVVDTGGLVPDTDDRILKEVQIKSWSAIAAADVLIWCIEHRQNVDTISDKIIDKIFKTGKPYIVSISKVDTPKHEKSIADYARLGGADFANFSASTIYGLSELMDNAVNQFQKLGFGPNTGDIVSLETVKKKTRRQKAKEVRRSADGKYYVVRNEDGLFESIDVDNSVLEAGFVENILIDWETICLLNKGKENKLVIDWLIFQKYSGRKIYLISSAKEVQEISKFEAFEIFDGYVSAGESGVFKPNAGIFQVFLAQYNLVARNCLLIDTDKNALDVAKELGFKIGLFEEEISLDKLLTEADGKEYQITKVVFLGKPNVGKSSLFNALVKQDIQIVSEIAGTTMSVNDLLVERKKKLTITLPENLPEIEDFDDEDFDNFDDFEEDNKD